MDQQTSRFVLQQVDMVLKATDVQADQTRQREMLTSTMCFYTQVLIKRKRVHEASVAYRLVPSPSIGIVQQRNHQRIKALEERIAVLEEQVSRLPDH